MEANPPSYETATIVDHWNIIARYMPSNDLCSAALVNSRWHMTFVPHLWGNPASHFGIENDRVYVALTKFNQTLQTARLLVRALTHTLHLPPAHAEIYNGPHADWLRDVLERLPNLQSLIVRGLPFFDHSALWALKHKPPKPDVDEEPAPGFIELPASAGFTFQRPADFVPSFGLRLLDASRCPNVTSSSLAQALGRFEGLLYLDLSFTLPARDAVVLNTLRRFTGLQVLKMRGLCLSDESVEVLASAIARRVRSLDIRDNNITDRGIRTLIAQCFTGIGDGEGNLSTGQRSPSLLQYMGADMFDIYQGEDFEGFLRNAFTGRFIGRLAIEDAPEGGITHLYIAGNHISVEAVSGLLRPGRLHVLDMDSVETAMVGRHLSNATNDGDDDFLRLPGVEKLTPILSKHATDSMTFLRIDQDIIAKDAPDLHPDEIIHGRVELSDTAAPEPSTLVAEMDGMSVRPDVFEVPAVSTPRYELPGDPMKVVVTPATNDPQHGDDELPSPNGPRRGSAFAPEPIDNITSEQPDISSPVSTVGESTISEATMANWTLMSAQTLCSPMSPIETTPVGTPITPKQEFLPPPPTTTRPRSYSSVVQERKARLSAHQSHKHNLHPAMLPHLRTLVLTDVPTTWPSKDLSDRLICFIKQCAEEATLARSQASLDYAIPPGRRMQAAALKHSAEKVFALKRLVLEMAPSGPRRSSKASPWQHEQTKSMTEDRDTESLWSAAETDFSFFGDEELSFPTVNSGRFAHAHLSNGKEVTYANQVPTLRSLQKAPAAPSFDTVALLSAFRKDRKMAHQRNIDMGVNDVDTEGYWDGVVQVVRPGTGLRADEELDYYGNRFENGWLYR